MDEIKAIKVLMLFIFVIMWAIIGGGTLESRLMQFDNPVAPKGVRQAARIYIACYIIIGLAVTISLAVSIKY